MRMVARIPLLILSFLLSLVLWAYVQVQEFPDKPASPSYTLKVQEVGLPSDMLIVGPPDPIKIFPVGSPDDWVGVTDNDFVATVDLKDAKPGASTYVVRVAVTGDHPGLRWEPKTSEVRIATDVKKSKEIPVVVQIYNELPTNQGYWYLPYATYTEPAMITVEGPKADVDNIESARAILDLSRVTPGGAYTSTLEVLQSGGRPAPTSITYNPKTVLVRPALAVGSESRELLVQPSYKGQPAPGYTVKSIEVTPDSVPVRGRPESLAAMKVLSTKEIDLTGLKATNTFTLTPDLPADVIMASPRPIIAKIVIEPTAPPVATKPVPTVKPPKTKTRRRKDR